MLRVSFLASGAGSSMCAIIDAAQAGRLAVAPVLAVSNKPNAPALTQAQARQTPVLHIPTRADPEGADRRLAEALTAARADLVVLSGYLRRLGPVTLGRFRQRIVNIHPGPLPRFGGQGMYGRRVHEAVIAEGLATTEICIHVVDGEYDHGPVIWREPLRLATGETVDSLEARVRAREPTVFVETLRRLTTGELPFPDLQPANISDNIP